MSAEPDRHTEAQRARRRGSIIGLATSGYITVLFGFVTGPITARVLGPSGRGEVAAAVVYSANIAVVLSFGLPNAVAYALATGRSTASRLLAAAIRYGTFLIAPSLLLAIYIAVALKHFTAGGRTGMLLMVGLTPLAVVALCIEGMVRAIGDLKLLARTRLISMTIPLLAVVGLALAKRLSVLTMAFVYIGTAAIGLAYTLSQVRARPERGDRLRPLLNYGARSAVSSTSLAVSARLDQILIAPLLGAAALGIYAVAVGVSSLPLGLAGAVSTRAFAAVGAAKDHDPLGVACKYVRLTLAVTLPLVIMLAIATPLLVPLFYGHKFGGAVVPAMFSLPATAAIAFFSAAEAGMLALGYPGRASVAQAVGTAIGVVALVLLLRPLGIEGAAIATSIDFMVSAALMAIFLRRLGPCTLFPRSADAREVLAGVRLAIARVIPLSPKPALVRR